MKITVLTTIAQHYKNPEIHIRNLKWALSNYEYRIIIQTFKKYNLNFIDKNIDIIEVDQNPNIFYHFWNHSSLILENFIEDTDFFLLMEQDILFYKKPIVKKNDSIIINLDSDYLSIYDDKVNRLYPRIWEGATFINKKIIESAINDKINFGDCCDSFKNKFYSKIKNYFTTNSCLRLNFQPIKKLVDFCNLDTLLEFSFYCFLKNYEYRLENDFSYEYGNYVLHLRGIDMMCHDNPKIYNNINEIINLEKENDVWKRLSAGCAFLLLLSGIYKKEKSLKKILKNNYKNSNILLLKKINFLLENSKDWLEINEIKNVFWAKCTIERKTFYI